MNEEFKLITGNVKGIKIVTFTKVKEKKTNKQNSKVHLLGVSVVLFLIKVTLEVDLLWNLMMSNPIVYVMLLGFMQLSTMFTTC